LLEGVTILEVAMFAPDSVGMHLADLGARVIKVEAPGLGDPARLLSEPYRGVSPAHRRWNRGKESLALDLRAEAGASVFRDLVGRVDAVIEGMRPGSLERRGLGYEALLEVNPRLVFVGISGWGEEGPYRDLGSHGLAFDAYAGLAPAREVDGRPARPSGHVWQGIEAAPLYGALAAVSAILRARETGEPCRIEVSQADAGAVWNGWRIAYEAAAAEHDSSPSGGSESVGSVSRSRVEALLAAAEGAGAEGADDRPGADVRYQYYAASDGMVLLMATETRFWENFCRAIDRLDLFERWPGQPRMDHDYGNDALREELARIFATRSQAEWVQLFIDHDVAGAPVHASGETHRDPHFQARDLWVDPGEVGLPILGSPVRVDGRLVVSGREAPTNGQDGAAILRDLLDYDRAQIERLREAGVISDAAVEESGKGGGG
jgi:crotonobetainyl-CoA:carnitine CoA-transferase CaiB-like acyl-CoA transferase